MEEQSKYFLGIFLILSSISLLFFKGKILDFKERTGDKLFSKKNRDIHEFRAWVIIISFFALGIWLLVKASL